MNDEINTKCGKSMKNLLYKYHAKKCDICKNKHPTVNMKAINSKLINRCGKGINDITGKKLNNRFDSVINDMKYAMKHTPEAFVHAYT